MLLDDIEIGNDARNSSEKKILDLLGPILFDNFGNTINLTNNFNNNNNNNQ